MRMKFAQGMALLLTSLVAFAPMGSAAETGKRVAVQSTSIVSLSYTPERRMLEVEFHSGALYRYREVPESIYTAFLRAESKGRYFSARVRGKFGYDKLREPKR